MPKLGSTFFLLNILLDFLEQLFYNHIQTTVQESEVEDMSGEKYYAAIDLKSFYASVECIYRNLDPMTTNLVVADPSRTEKTICLAVSPSLKALGVPGRPRLFEVVQKIAEVNALRQGKAPGKRYSGSAQDAVTLSQHPEFSVDYIVVPPQMALYMQFSAKIYEIYLKYVAPEDIHVYSIDEVFIDLTPYLRFARMTPRQFVTRMIRDVYETTGITATCGIGTNLYLCKVAMDIVAKKAEADETGMRIAELDEMEYRRLLWSHEPLTDFWRVGRGYSKRLNKVGLRTMGDIARCSLGGPNEFHSEDLLYKLFGVNAELLIDHAWGYEPTTIQSIKAYRPESSSVSSGQVLHCPYAWEKAQLVIREMADLLALDLVEKGLVCHQIVLTVGYDIENLTDPNRRKSYTGQVTVDHYGRQIPKHAHGTYNLPRPTASTALFLEAVHTLCGEIMDKSLLVRRINITANHVIPESAIPQARFQQLDLFATPDMEAREQARDAWLAREHRRQKAVLAIKHKYGKNAILRGMNLEEGATARDRNRQVGGHKA